MQLNKKKLSVLQICQLCIIDDLNTHNVKERQLCTICSFPYLSAIDYLNILILNILTDVFRYHAKVVQGKVLPFQAIS